MIKASLGSYVHALSRVVCLVLMPIHSTCPLLVLTFRVAFFFLVCYTCRIEFAHSACGEVLTRNDCSNSRVSQSVRIDLILPSSRL